MADTGPPLAVKPGDYVRVVPTSPLVGAIGSVRKVLEVFLLGGVAFGVLTPKDTTIPPIVPVDELVRAKGAGTRDRRRYRIRARSASAATWPNAGHCGPSATRSRAARASSLRPL